MSSPGVAPGSRAAWGPPMSQASLGLALGDLLPLTGLRMRKKCFYTWRLPFPAQQGRVQGGGGYLFLDTQESSSWRPVAFRPSGGPLWSCLGHREAGVHREGKAKRRPIWGGLCILHLWAALLSVLRVDLHRRIPLRKIWRSVGVRPQALKLEAWILV